MNIVTPPGTEELVKKEIRKELAQIDAELEHAKAEYGEALELINFESDEHQFALHARTGV